MLARISIERPVFAWMLMAAMIIFGAIAFSKLGISQLPDADFPVVSVSLSLNGAAPEVMEAQVLDPIEDAIMQMDGIRAVTSTAQQSSASISIEFEFGNDINNALEEVKNHVNQVWNMLPSSLSPPVYRKINPEDQPIMWLGLSARDPSATTIDMMIYAKNTLTDQFGMVDGVGNVVCGGYVEPTLRVWLDAKKMGTYDVTAQDVLNVIKTEQVEYPAGQISDGKVDRNIRVLGETRSVKDFGDIRILSRGSAGTNYRPIKLSQVARIEEGTADVRRIMRMNGRPGVGIGIIKQHGSNAVEVSALVLKKLQEVALNVPKNMQLNVRTDNTRFIRQSVNQLIFTLGLSALFTSLVCYFFLGSISSTINVLMAIPTSIIGTFTVLYFFGFTLNTFTLLGLSLAIGIVVDDAIMMLENIVRHREMGKSKRKAALEGAQEITFAALAATIAVVAIFAPVIFMKGIIGRYFFQYGITVASAVLLSLLEALTLTPMRCSRYLSTNTKESGFFHVLQELYRRVLVFLLQHRWKTILLAIVFFGTSLCIAKKVPSEMMPAQDQSMFMLRFKLPVGTAIDVTGEKMLIVEEYIKKMPGFEGMLSVIGGFGGDAVNQSMAYVTLVPRSKRVLSQADIIKKVRQDLKKMLPDMESVVQDLSTRGFSASRGFPVELTIQGPDWQELTKVSDVIMDAMRASKMIVDVNADIQKGMAEVRLHPNRQKMADYAVASSAVTSALNILMGGQILNRESEYPKDNDRYAIEVRFEKKYRLTSADLRHVYVRNNRGQRVKLLDVVDVHEDKGLLLISRFNRMRSITIYGNPAPQVAQKDALLKAQGIAEKLLPPGTSILTTGSSQSYMESFRSLMFALVLGVLVSYMVLASQFNSFLHPLVVLLALPFSLSGAFLALYLGHQSLNMFSMIGFILLMGIVKKNSILLVDFTNQCRSEGMGLHAALIRACPVRLRPILMTSIATVVGALPEALSIGPGSETTIPMAIAIIGGVIASTFLTLLVVPCAYSLLSYFESPAREG